MYLGAADDDSADSVAPIHEVDAGLRALVERAWRARGGQGEAMPGRGVIAGRGRVDMRFAEDADGELYVLTKTDGMIRKVVGASLASAAPRQLTTGHLAEPGGADREWDHGGTDGEIFTAIERGIPPTMMAGYDGRIPDTDIWHIVNDLRTLRQQP